MGVGPFKVYNLRRDLFQPSGGGNSKRHRYLFWFFLFVVIIVFAEAEPQEIPAARWGKNGGNIIRYVETQEKVLALTFDDGPDVATSEILDLLAAYGGRATFFAVGKQLQMFPELALRIVAEGHDLANHTYSHPRMNSLSEKQLQEEIGKTEDIILKITGQRPRFFRPPYGEYNQALADFLAKRGYTIVLWSEDSRDFARDRSVEKIVGNALTGLQSGDIILFHDGGPREMTVTALKLILPKLRAEGYALLNLSELTKFNRERKETSESGWARVTESVQP
ncbi:MAG: polysaccharide deacetylase family protein [Firmicutes bacterium]|nr:polysaccharide deacetylase family protein [Bacillota bacterium]MCL5038874.1 polysaccharide deacetylase family protein [Bacillota bacterium]